MGYNLTAPRALMWLALAAGACPRGAWPGPVTSCFQSGVSPEGAYTQCVDSTLRSLTGHSFGMQSLGRAPALDPRWADSEGAMLLRFDVSSIPSFAAVSSAALRIRFEPNEFESTSGYLAAHRLGDPSGTGMWQENTNAASADYGTADPAQALGCAAYKRPNTAWTASGGRVTDIILSTVRVWHVAQAAEWIELDVTDAVGAFVRTPSANLGWLVRAETDDTLRGDLFTSDAAAPSNRPQLRVVFDVPDTPPTNRSPVLTPIGDRNATTGALLQFTVSATDLDGDTLSFAASNLPPGAAFAPPQFSWTPAAGQTGAFPGVVFHVGDGRGGSDSESVTLTVAAAGTGATYYVRPDGGSAQQCNGLVDAPYPGSGEGQACAWDHPFRALPPGGPPRLAGGDTLIIGPGSYRMGYGAPGADACNSGWPWDCHMPPVPGGPSPGRPTRILGAGWDSGCTNKPELWGAERAAFIFNLTGSTNVEIGCLELTDHLGCADFHSGGLACPRGGFPFGDWCQRGLYAQDSHNVYLHDLDIHGFAYAGIQAGRLADWTLENVRLAGNGWAGWDGDIAGDDSNTGALFFSRFSVEWNGCVETWPGGQPTGCWAQTAGGYGDGLGTGQTGGNWVFVDCIFRYNTSDGLDLLYVREPGSFITISRTLAEGNAGNQLKTAGPAHLENCIVVGNCAFFNGQPFTHNVDNCRALGNTLSLDLGPGDQVSVLNSTITGEGDCLVLAGCQGSSCDGSESVILRNNIFLGQTDFLQPVENTCLTYADNLPGNPFDMDFCVITNVKGGPCPVGPRDLCQSPRLFNMTLEAFDARLLSNSPAIDAGTNLAAVGHDVDGVSRPLDGRRDGTNRHDIGAYEYAHPLADSDGDMMGDADEATAGTDATNPAAFFRIEAIHAQPDPLVRWPGVPGRRYDLFAAPAMTGVWEAVAAGANLTGLGGTMTFSNEIGGDRRFFRLRVRKP